MTNVFAPNAPTFLKTTDGRDFPVSRVFCVGRNYAAHAVEMGKDPGGHIAGGRIHLTVNGETRQDADINDLIWSVPEIIVHLSALYELRPGDLIYTGTPAGVGPVVSGDEIICTIAGLPDLKVRIGAPFEQSS